MKIPNKIKIGAHEYEVIRQDDSGDAEGLFGHCLTRKLKIYVDDRTASSQQEETLLHEVGHAICDQIHAFPKTEAGREDEERVVQGLIHGLYQVLKDNDFLK